MYRLEEQLRKLKKPDLNLDVHQAHLRKKITLKFQSRSNFMFNMSFYKILPAGLAMAILLFLGSMFISNKLPSIIAPVSAAEIIEDVLQKVQNLTPLELENIQQKMHLPDDSSFLTLLEEAKNAPDLRIVPSKAITCDEANRIGNEMQIIASDTYNTYVGLVTKPCINPRIWELSSDQFTEKGNKIIKTDGEQVTFLEFTQRGTIAAIGIDKNYLPSESFYTLSVEGLTVNEKLVNDTFKKILSLNPGELKKIIEKLNLQDQGDLFALLTEAQVAKDLATVEASFLTCDEAQKILNAMPNASEKNKNYSAIGFDGECNYAKEWSFKSDDFRFENSYLIATSDQANDIDLIFLEYTKNGARKAIGINKYNIITVILDYTPGHNSLHFYAIDSVSPEKN